MTTEITQFDELGLAAPLLKAVQETGYTTPTPIQAKAIPLANGHRKNGSICTADFAKIVTVCQHQH
jgi:superfamily II DNA/RNA helicase